MDFDLNIAMLFSESHCFFVRYKLLYEYTENIDMSNISVRCTEKFLKQRSCSVPKENLHLQVF